MGPVVHRRVAIIWSELMKKKEREKRSQAVNVTTTKSIFI